MLVLKIFDKKMLVKKMLLKISFPIFFSTLPTKSCFVATIRTRREIQFLSYAGFLQILNGF